MKDLKSIRRRARAVVASAAGPLGPLPTQWLVHDNLDFFSDLRDAGGSWDQIAKLLRDEGLLSRRGGSVEAGVLRALYSRAMQEKARLHVGRSSSRTTIRAADAPTLLKGTGSSPSRPLPGLDSLAARLERVTRLRGPMQAEE